MSTAFVIVRDNVDQPLVARSYARDKTMGRPSLSEAFARVGRDREKTGDSKDVLGRTTYVFSDDSILLMIGQTAELEAGCKVANETKPCINFIEAESGKSLQLRYARIQVHPVSKQTDTLIALGATLPDSSKDGWHECKGWPMFSKYVTTADKTLQENVQSLPGWIREIKENDGKKWIDA